VVLARRAPNDPSAAAAAALFALQVRTFVLTWVGYASYYFTRKNLSVVKSRLHDTMGLSTTTLGAMDTLYLACYALGMFLSGTLGDRIGARRLLTLGMLGSAAMAVWFGVGSSPFVFTLAFAINGLFQSTGWPGTVKAMQPFFTPQSRGQVMGLWTTNYQVGGLLATALATFILVRVGWRQAFILPAVWVATLGIVIALFLVERPEDRGLPPVHDPECEPASPAQPARNEPPPGRSEGSPGLLRLLQKPILWALGGSYFGLKMIRYSLLFWLPFYLKQHLHYSEGQAGYLSMPFELGGVIGSIAVGWISDHYFRSRRLRLAVPLLFVLGGALLAYQSLGGAGMVVNAALLAGVGFLLFGPDSLLSGTMAQDLGGREATGRVAGIINGMGSVGAIFSPVLVAQFTKHLGWDALFYGFFALTVLAGSLLALASQLSQAPSEPAG
jgi:OPA family glycerol-3-phosphate transporter-like MFS transporter